VGWASSPAILLYKHQCARSDVLVEHNIGAIDPNVPRSDAIRATSRN
jgi:hypothetical protein